MPDDIEQRLTAAAEALREHEATAARCADLRDRMGQLAEHVTSLSAEYAREQTDVARLEGLSLTRLLATLRGARDDALAREQAEAEAVRYQVADAQARLDAVRREHGDARARLDQLADAPATYARILDEKELYLAESDDPRGRQLLDLAAERGRLTGEAREVAEAQQAARAAAQALAAVSEKLGSASSWSTYDTFFGGGMISSAMKHSRLDEAARAAAHADQCIAVLRDELADVADGGAVGAPVSVDGLTRFVDIWFDNIFTDFAVASRIKQAQANIDRSRQMVRDVGHRLDERARQNQARLAAIETERRNLLASS